MDLALEDRVHLDMFAGCRHMQRAFCLTLSFDWSEIILAKALSPWIVDGPGEAGFKRCLEENSHGFVFLGSHSSHRDPN